MSKSPEIVFGKCPYCGKEINEWLYKIGATGACNHCDKPVKLKVKTITTLSYEKVEVQNEQEN